MSKNTPPPKPSLKKLISDADSDPNQTLLSFDDSNHFDYTDETIRIDKGLTRSIPPSRFGKSYWVVRVAAGQDLMKYIVMSPNTVAWIGRDEQAHLQIKDRAVSKQHAQLACIKEENETDNHPGRLFIKDNRSTNGTFVNRKRIHTSELHNNDHLDLGDVSLRVNLMNQEELKHLKQVVTRLEEANHDPLTGLLTRAFMTTELDALVSQAQKSGQALSCGFVDLDKFKSTNDTFGHQIGDSVLKNVAWIMMYHLRNSDFCVRYGGDEFIIFLPKTDEEDAKQVFERIRIALQRHPWSKLAQGLHVSASFGVSEYKLGESKEEWIEKADQAVYFSKNQGRNKVFTYSDIQK